MTNIFSKKDAQRKKILAIPFNTFLKPPKVVPNKHLHNSCSGYLFLSTNQKANEIGYLYLCNSNLPEVVRSHKPLVTDRAYEVFLSGVCPCVSGQFVRSSETFATPQP